jgi:hypothetical protein
MIRFIDLRGQATGCRFAYWDTVRDCFLMADGVQAWDTFDDFAAVATDAEIVERCRGLTPQWAKDPAPLDEDGCVDDSTPPAPHIKVTEVVGRFDFDEDGCKVGEARLDDLLPEEAIGPGGDHFKRGQAGRFRITVEFWPEPLK